MEKAKILFVCVENSCRSQISEGMARLIASDIFEPYSAGSRPSGVINPSAIAVLEEKGADVSGQRSKGLNDLPAIEWDAIVTMGCGDACPHLPAKLRLDWALADPKGKPLDEFRRTRDDIARRIQALADERRASI